MSLTPSSTPDASAVPAEESRLLESQAELEIEENPKLARKEGLAPAADAAPAAASSGRPSDPPGTSSADEPELHNEEDLPSDGHDPEGERMIRELGNEPHLRQPQEGG